ncbi:MAG: UPF0182 family protein [Clostridiales Family XIII bacterium]|nr:UPF0182 family protein [Clostridiales Family XIII bacterium]
MKDKRRKIITIVLIVAVVLIALIAGLAGFITDFLWFRDLGYTAVFWKKLLTMLKIGVPVFIVLSVLGIAYLKTLRKGYFKRTSVAEYTMGVKGQSRVGYLLAIAASFIVTYVSVSNLWFELLKFTNSSGFDLKDPIFNNDVSFYVFKLQFIKELNSIVIIALVAFAILTFVYYYFLLQVAKPSDIDGKTVDEPEPEPQPKQKQNAEPGILSGILKSLGLNFEGSGGSGFNATEAMGAAKKSAQGSGMTELVHIASKQITVLGILFFLMIGVNYLLKQYNLLYSNNGVVFGAGYTDMHLNLWVYRIIMCLAVIAAIFFAIGISKKKLKTVIIVPIAMIGVGILGAGAGLIMQNLIVDPDAISKEGAYLEHNIAFTQNAYGISDVTSKPFAATNDLTQENIKANSDTIRNIRINDYDPTKTFYNLSQAIRQYYTFNDVDVDRYMVNGQYTQTFLSAREIDESKIDQQWLNVHLKYTHGYGVTLSRVDKVTASGQPDIMIKNIPPESQVEEIDITRPEIYFGELQNQYIITNTDEKEFDYPEGTENKYSTYESDTGIKMNLFNRIMFSIEERSLKLLISTNIKADSKIIVKRNIKERVQTIMPYLDYGDPYMVTVDGKLYWIIDAFTTSSMFPYSEPYDLASGSSTNYIRNSVKIVIDAYTGTTDFFTVDKNDPVAVTLAKIYPTLFKDADTMPESLKAHIRYPSLMLSVQANIYKKYHVEDIDVFYQKEDLWEIANEKLGASDREVPMTPNYYIMKLPGEKDVEFINSIPYTPKDKVNMTALLIARNDGEHYGELMLLQLPKGRIIMGPAQIDAQIAQDPQISQDFSLWANSDSTYSRGNMFVVPIEDSLMYVEPIYLKAQDSSMPEVKRIILYYGDRIAYESTLGGALDAMFGPGTGDSITDTDLTGDEGDADSTPDDTGTDPAANVGDDQQKTTDELLKLAVAAYNNAVEAQKAGDWAKYGEYMKELEGYLSQPELSTAEQAAAGTETETGTGAAPAEVAEN